MVFHLRKDLPRRHPPVQDRLNQPTRKSKRKDGEEKLPNPLRKQLRDVDRPRERKKL